MAGAGAGRRAWPIGQIACNGRIVTFRDDERCRIVWSAVGGPYSHHDGMAQVSAEDSRARSVWTADLLPHELAATTWHATEEGLSTIEHLSEAAGCDGVRPAAA